MMDQALIRKTAEELEFVLNKYCDVNEYVGYLKNSMIPLIRDAKNEKITEPVKCNTSTYRILFEEHGLRGLRDLERAYAHFRLQITGGMTDQRRRLLEIFEKNKKEIEEQKRKKALEEGNKPD
ncbi:MAG: hypothetical protein ABF876_05765 [Acetobacter aceti]|uniref:Uncharacterized protein n=1 Tax=Acetobacter aceti TaxID=435 RepID=A0A1U9KCZ7_ACEAC|nr:hypothetical protein [Acetobacter aceti]AQS83642.1 hypothetical protein A0U92_01390 [Acetobacter aceti]